MSEERPKDSTEAAPAVAVGGHPEPSTQNDPVPAPTAPTPTAGGLGVPKATESTMKRSAGSTMDVNALKAAPQHDLPPPGPSRPATRSGLVDLKQLSGVVPLFLTTATQALFKVKAGEDVTVEKPFRFVPKADIVADMFARAAISDFSPAKQTIQEYPGEELLLHYDAEFVHGQNFFLVLAPESIKLLTEPTPAATQQAVEVKKERRRGWECLGSDKDIESERVVPSRNPVHIRVSRRRREFGDACKFGDRDAHDGFSECRPFRDPAYEINRVEVNASVQAVPHLAHTGSQTGRTRPINFALQYEPIVLRPEEQDAAMTSDEVNEFLTRVVTRFEKALSQNSIQDIFRDDYLLLGEEDASIEQGSHTVLQEYQSFTDLKHSKEKSIACVDWHPTQRGVVAISCVQRSTLDERVQAGFNARAKASVVLIWSFHDPIHPQLVLQAPDDVLSFQFNPLDSNIIVGGCANGQLVVWDIVDYQDKLKSSRRRHADDSGKEKQAETPVLHYTAMSTIESSHRAPVTDLKWFPKHFELAHSGEIMEQADNGHKQLVSVSLDGQVFFWDLRYKKDLKSLDLTWKPFMKVPLSAMDNTFDYGLTKIAIDITPPPDKHGGSETNLADPKLRERNHHERSTKFYCATEEGDLIHSDWMAEKAEDKAAASRVDHAWSYHYGPMNDLQRSPFLRDILLSVGGWSFHIWKESVVGGPVLSSAPSQAYLVSGRWSPTRPGVFFISRADGTIEIWDLLDRSYMPSNIQNVSSVGISTLCIHQYHSKTQSHSQFIAAGDDLGTLHILEVPRNLTKATKNEKAFVKAFFERESKRITYVQGRQSYRQKERAKHELVALEAAAKAGNGGTGAGGPGVPGAPAGGKPDDKKPEDEDEAAEQEYIKLEKNFLEAF